MGYNILIVDDSRIVRKVIKKTFALTNIEVEAFHEAGDGVEALKQLENNWVDIIFTDINMPNMNGLELVKNIMKNDMINSIPIVVVSTEGSDERIEELNRLGIKAYIRKPFTPEALNDVIEKCL